MKKNIFFKKFSRLAMFKLWHITRIIYYNYYSSYWRRVIRRREWLQSENYSFSVNLFLISLSSFSSIPTEDKRHKCYRNTSYVLPRLVQHNINNDLHREKVMRYFLWNCRWHIAVKYNDYNNSNDFISDNKTNEYFYENEKWQNQFR